VYVCNNGGAWLWREGEEKRVPGDPPPEYHGGSIQRIDLHTGEATTLYDSCDGRPLNSPNDIVFDRQGGFWFTCFGQTDGEVRRLGALYYARPDGSRITRWRHGVTSPNGVGLSPDGRTIYMADRLPGRLLANDLTAPGMMLRWGRYA
jgi:gluconolactonase